MLRVAEAAAYVDGVMWEVEYTDEFERWWLELTVDQQEALHDRVMLLAEIGPGLRRPAVGRITGVPACRHEGAVSLKGRSSAGAVRVRSEALRDLADRRRQVRPLEAVV